MSGLHEQLLKKTDGSTINDPNGLNQADNKYPMQS